MILLYCTIQDKGSFSIYNPNINYKIEITKAEY